ncbi:MAG: ABC transporter permease subunit [Pseudomonadota bacterium]|nr:ABC transporter permease subunit [Pseudomonadota bacterium]
MQFSGIPGRLIPRIANVGVIPKPALGRQHLTRFWFDALAFSLVLAFFAYISWGMNEISAPLTHLAHTPISLDVHRLPEYAMRTTLRMLIAVVVSLAFTLTYATAAAKSRKAGQILIPLLDILQSVPVLGYISFTVTGFIALFPGSMLGVECAAIFAIFTSQAWNMAFSLYQSLKTIPHDIDEAAFVFKLSGWQKFWKMELPYAMPGLIWNTMMSMSGGWFFVVASEAITVGSQHITLPGVGSYIALAIERRNLHAIGYAIAAMTVVILLYDQLLFRPLVAWSDKFRYEMTAGGDAPRSWVLELFTQSRRAKLLLMPFGWLAEWALRLRLFVPKAAPSLQFSPREARLFDYLWYALLALVGVVTARHLVIFLMASVSLSDALQVSWLALLTLTRVVVLIALASLVWVPLGILIGLNHRLAQMIQPLAQFLAAFPANLLFPVAVMLISRYDLNPDIWLSPLMILGTQWYICFNVIAGASAFPNDMREAARNFRVHGWLWWKKVMVPGVFPYFLTGAITASGGAWNASIVAEAVQWGDKSYTAKGLGAYIAEMTAAGDFPHIALGVGAMAIVVVMCNKFFWRPLYDMAARKLRFD